MRGKEKQPRLLTLLCSCVFHSLQLELMSAKEPVAGVRGAARPAGNTAHAGGPFCTASEASGWAGYGQLVQRALPVYLHSC